MRPSNLGGGKRRYIFALHGQADAFVQPRSQNLAERRADACLNSTRPVSLAAVADADLLFANLRAIRTIAGRGPGPEGVTYYELGRLDEYAACRETAQLLRCGSYHPSAPRDTQIETMEGGQRTLTLRCILDRAVARAVKSTVEPVIDRHFLETSYGFRSGRNVLNLLAALAAEIEGGRRVLVVSEVCGAFENVRIERVLPLIAQYVTDPKLLSLIANILRGGDRPEDHPVGIDPDCSLSPLTLNLQLHHALDTQLRAQSGLPVVHRHADKLAAACVTESDAFRMFDQTSELLQVEGHALNRELDGIFRLKDGQEAELLGFQIQFSRGRVRLRTPGHALNGFKERLENVWALPNPTLSAKMALVGWMSYYGPGIRRSEEDGLLDCIRDLTDRLSLQEALNIDLLRRKRVSAAQSWKRVLSEARTGRAGSSQ